MDNSNGDGSLPASVIARIDVTMAGVRVVLRDGMSVQQFAEVLRMLADGFESGSIQDMN